MSEATQLYHGSKLSGLTSLDPQRTLSHDRYIGDFVFATKSNIMAAMYLIPHEIGIELMEYKEKPPRLVIQATEDTFNSLDHGGSIYTLSTDKFHKTPQIGLEDSEMVCEQSVSPVSEERFKTIRDAFTHYGIKLYLLEKEAFDQVMAAGDDSWKILKNIEPTL